MSQLPAAPAKNGRSPTTGPSSSPAQRPTWVDFFCLLLGFAISLILAEWSKFDAAATEPTPPFVVDHLLSFLPRLLLLPVGPLLFWPLFWLTQWLRGRTEPMSSGEWLWGMAWLALLPAVTWVCWQHLGTPPELLPETFNKRWIGMGYAVGVLALGSLAAVITLFGLIARWPRPWTHNLCLVLLIWPAIWLTSFMAWGIVPK